MTTVFDVPAELLINTIADEFKDNNEKTPFINIDDFFFYDGFSSGR